MGKLIDDVLLQYLSLWDWEHINLTGDYVWRQNRKIEERHYRSLRTSDKPFSEFRGYPNNSLLAGMHPLQAPTRSMGTIRSGRYIRGNP